VSTLSTQLGQRSREQALGLSADGKPDYVLYGPSVQGTTLWYLDNNVFTGSANGPTLPAGWSLTQR